MGLASSVSNVGYTANQPHKYNVSSPEDAIFPSSHLSLLNRTCLWRQQPVAELASPVLLVGHSPLHLSITFPGSRGQARSSGFTRHSRPRVSSDSLACPQYYGYTYNFLIKYLLAQSLISFRPDLVSLQLRLICMAVNTGLTKLTNCDKS